MELEETATNSTNTENPPTNDSAELVTEVDEKNVAYRLRKHCCGGGKVLAITTFVVVVVVVAVVLYSIYRRGKSAWATHHAGKCNVHNLTRQHLKSSGLRFGLRCYSPLCVFNTSALPGLAEFGHK